MTNAPSLHQLADDIRLLLDRVFSSGLYALDLEVVVEARQLQARCEQYGLQYASDILSRFAEQVEIKRHEFSDPFPELCETVILLGLYLKELQHRIFFSDR